MILKKYYKNIILSSLIGVGVGVFYEERFHVRLEANKIII